MARDDEILNLLNQAIEVLNHLRDLVRGVQPQPLAPPPVRPQPFSDDPDDN